MPEKTIAFLKLRERTQTESMNHLKDEHEDCSACQMGQNHFTLFRQRSLYIALTIAASAYIVMAKLPIPAILGAAGLSYLVSFLLFSTLESAVAKSTHEFLETIRDVRLRMIDTLARLHARSRINADFKLEYASIQLSLFLDNMGEAKQVWRGNDRLHTCLSGIVQLRELEDEVQRLKLENKAADKRFTKELQELFKAIKSNSLGIKDFEARVVDLYQELILLEQACDRLEEMDLRVSAKKSLATPDPEIMRLAVQGFISAFTQPHN